MTAADTWDFIVVGGGSSGAVVAARLSEEPGTRVLLLDAGRSHRHPFIDVPALMMFSFPRRDMNWRYIAEADPSRGGRVDMWPAGKALGGGSAINGMMFVRGHDYDYDLWAQMGARGWSSADVLPYFRRLETSDTGASEQRGGDGPVAVEAPRSPHPLAARFIEACGQVGIPRSDDLNGAQREGAGLCQASQRRGRRASTAHAYLDPVARRANLRVVTGATVDRILFDGTAASGVAWRESGVARESRALRGVVVCAGAIATPRLLMLSGIGDPEQLADHGIVTLAARSGVGRNLQEHSGAGVRFETTVPTLTSDQGPIRSPLHALDYLLRRRGPLATPIGHAQAFIRTEPGLAAPDIQLILNPSAYDIEGGKAKRRKDRQMGIAVGLCRPRSRGRVRLRSADPDATPVIEHSLFDDADDVRRIVAGIRVARDVLNAPAMKPFVVRETAPGAARSDEELGKYVRRNAFLMFHPSGTCRMGGDQSSVVDDRLRVRGVGRLWIADASIIPTIPAGNINATCIMIGEKAADMIREDTGIRKAAA